ncbi:MAG: hypothetical protein HC853_16345, partial [Anaerolineae bacterium]|nr:hypothetical protein [Anaerolineae bacterium]
GYSLSAMTTDSKVQVHNPAWVAAEVAPELIGRDQELAEVMTERLRERLGEPQFEKAERQGQAMTLVDALQLSQRSVDEKAGVN